MTAAALRLKLNLKEINMQEQEHLRPTFLRISPHHIVPTLVDNEFSMFESRAICIYLVEKYGKNDALYPKNPKIRASINHLIYFDMGTLFKRFYEYFMPIYQGKGKSEEKLNALKEAMGFLDTFLTDKKFAVNYRLTIADLILLASISTIDTVGFNFEPYVHVCNWYSNMQSVAPGYDLNKKGLNLIKEMMGKTQNQEVKPEVIAGITKADEPPSNNAEKLEQFGKIKFDISDDGKVILSPGIVVDPPALEPQGIQTIPEIVVPPTQGIQAIPEIISPPTQAIQAIPEIEQPQAIVTPLIEVTPNAPSAIATPLIEITPNSEVTSTTLTSSEIIQSNSSTAEVVTVVKEVTFATTTSEVTKSVGISNGIVNGVEIVENGGEKH